MLIKVSIVFTKKKKKKTLIYFVSSIIAASLQGNAYHFVSKVCQCFWLCILITFFWDVLFYLLKNVSFTTTDIAECEEDKKCTDKQICVNKPGSYDCLCIKGYHKEGGERVPHPSQAIHLAVGEYIIFSISSWWKPKTLQLNWHFSIYKVLGNLGEKMLLYIPYSRYVWYRYVHQYWNSNISYRFKPDRYSL